MKVHKAKYRQYWVGISGQRAMCGHSPIYVKHKSYYGSYLVFCLEFSERWKNVTCKKCLKLRKKEANDGH